MQKTLYKDRKFKSWTILRLAEVLCEEWAELNPVLIKQRIAYSSKMTSIQFKGEITVTLDIEQNRYPPENTLQVPFSLSLSPTPDSLEFHVLNTFQFGSFVGRSSKMGVKNCFDIHKTEPWEGSVFQKTAEVSKLIIEQMLEFDSCFDLLVKDKVKVGDEIFDMRELKLTQHLNRVKAYRFAEIYGHAERLDEAVDAIKKGMKKDESARRQVKEYYQKMLAGHEDWLYTKEMLERICE